MLKHLFLIFTLSLFTQAVLADVYKSKVFLGPVERPITSSAVQAICSGIYNNLTNEAVQYLDVSKGNPFECGKCTDSDCPDGAVIQVITYIKSD